ncbi:MAG: response regulator transcription factor [Oligoflexales bacterium]|nr:response regulator transcription factor [Oligoflexales bacterium]
MHKNKTTLVIVDDHPVLRRGLKALIEQDSQLQVRREFAGIRQTLDYLEKCQSLPHVALVDLSLQDGNGIDLIKTIANRFSAIKVLVLSILEESVFAARCLAVGARGYIMKSEGPDRMLAAVRAVAKGQLWLSESVSLALIDKQIANGRVEPQPEKLSRREREVLGYIRQGFKSGEIASIMGISSKTVNSHKESLKQKLGAITASQLAVYAGPVDA